LENFNRRILFPPQCFMSSDRRNLGEGGGGVDIQAHTRDYSYFSKIKHNQAISIITKRKVRQL